MKKSLIVILVLLSVLFAAVTVLYAQEGTVTDPAPMSETTGTPEAVSDENTADDPAPEAGAEQPEVPAPADGEAEGQPEVQNEPEADEQNDEIIEEQPEVQNEPEVVDQDDEIIEEQPEVQNEPEAEDQNDEINEEQPEVQNEPEAEDQNDEINEEQPEVQNEPEAEDQNDEINEEQPEVQNEPEAEDQDDEIIEDQPEVQNEPEAEDQNDEINEEQPAVQTGAVIPEEKEGMIVHIFGNQKTAEFNEEEQSAEGFRFEVTCGDLEGEDKDACEAYTDEDFYYDGEAEAKGTGPDKFFMGLDAELFVNENQYFIENEIEIEFVVEEDGFIDITVKTEEPAVWEEPCEEEEEQNEGEGDGNEVPEEPAPAVIPEEENVISNGIITIHLDPIEDEQTEDEEQTVTDENTADEDLPEDEETAEEELTEGEENAEEELTEEEEIAEEELTEGEELSADEELPEGEENPEEELPEEEEIAEDEEFEMIASDENEEELPEEEIEEPEETAEEEAEEEKQVLVSTETRIFAAQDEEGDILMTTVGEVQMKLNLIEGEWALVELADGTLGYVKLADLGIDPEAAAEAEEELSEEEASEEEPAPLTGVVKTDMVLRTEADGQSPVFFTLDADTEVTVLAEEGDWLLVLLPDGETQGWVYYTDIELPAAEEDEAEPAEGEEPETEPAAEEAAPAPKEKKVTIFTSRRVQMEIGEDIVLTSLLEGFEDCKAIKYQWECDKGDGFEVVEGADGDSYTYAASEESMEWSFRLVVLYR